LRLNTHTPHHALLLHAALALAGVAHAQTQPAACPTSFASPTDFQTQTSQHQQLQQLATMATACEHNASYHAYRGLLLLTLGENTQALEALEKALMLNPELPGAQLDYAQALALAGQKTAARDILHSVLQRPDFPVALRPQLQPADPNPATPWRWNALVQVSRGHESNLANATGTQDITLLLPNGPVTIALADTERPRPGLASKAQAQGQLTLPLPVGGLQLYASYLGRQAGDQASVADPIQLETGSAWAVTVGSGTLVSHLVAQQVSIAHQTAYRDTTLSLKYETAPLWGACQWAPELGASRPSYSTSPVLNGRHTFARLGLTCQRDLDQTRLTLTAGVDTPLDPARPGGTRHQQELQLRHDRLVSDAQLSLWARWNSNQDAAPFSALLGNLTAHTRLTSLGVGLWHSVSKRWSLGAELESTTQKSNNTLNNINNQTLYAGVRWAWR
jgi:hypothetical protein